MWPAEVLALPQDTNDTQPISLSLSLSLSDVSPILAIMRRRAGNSLSAKVSFIAFERTNACLSRNPVNRKVSTTYPTFNNYDSVFVPRRCLSISNRARQLVTQSEPRLECQQLFSWSSWAPWSWVWIYLRCRSALVPGIWLSSHGTVLYFQTVYPGVLVRTEQYRVRGVCSRPD